MDAIKRRQHIHELDPDLRDLLFGLFGLAYDQRGHEAFSYYGA